MFTKIDRYVNESFEILTSKRRDEILDSANKLTSDYDRYNKSKFVVITNNQINIQSRPSTLAPFRGVGKIKLTISQNLDKTIIKCDIYPFSNSFSYIIILGLILMTIWTLVGLLISTKMNSNSWIILGVGWVGAFALTYNSLIANKKRLRNYSKGIIEKLTK